MAELTRPERGAEIPARGRVGSELGTAAGPGWGWPGVPKDATCEKEEGEAVGVFILAGGRDHRATKSFHKDLIGSEL